MVHFFTSGASDEREGSSSWNTVSEENEWAKVEKKNRAMTEQTDFVVVIRHPETRFSFDY
tara:strand:+ start:4609 stop:4788 length:180 start_codon:yes stop_codon:yes gene_type:complete